MRLLERLVPPLALSVTLSVTLMACGGDEPPDDESGATPGSPSQSSSPSAPSTSSPTAAPPPGDRTCYRIDFDEALAPTSDVRATDCAKPHTSMTYAVGSLAALVDGRPVPVDSPKVQARVARTCPERLSGFLGGTVADLRLSMLRAVWFTPSLEESDAGADWYRCDVIAVAADGFLAPLTGQLAGVLDRPEASAAYGVCGTAEPGTEAFSRVICARDHAWRAISTVGFAGRTYPGAGAVRAAGQAPCEEAARERAADPLDFQWGYEWPTQRQWDAGQTYGLCWVPD